MSALLPLVARQVVGRDWYVCRSRQLDDASQALFRKTWVSRNNRTGLPSRAKLSHSYS